MLASVGSLAGLVTLPIPIPLMGMNHLIFLKRKANFKHHEWPRFNEVLLNAVKEQETEFAKAIFSQGEYEIVKEYKLPTFKLDPDE